MLWMLDNGGFEVIEGDVVGDLVGFRVFNNIRPNNLVLLGFRFMQQPMIDFLPRKSRVHIKALQVPLEQVLDSIDILSLHGSKAGSGSMAGKVVLGDLASFGRALGERREADLIKLQPVQRTVVIPA